ncbi:MAG: hypothetical protein FWC13_08330 [Oscillospiraceae bacterium]|nr:hypothetical protein [Oscillospiraceae bacterium]
MTDDGIFVKTLFRKHATLNILALLTSTVGPIVTTVIAGTHFGSAGLAILAICSPLFLTASFFGFIISGGAQIVCSGFIAKDEMASVRRVYSAAALLTLIAATTVGVLTLIFKVPLLTLLAGEISPELSAYYYFFVINAFMTMFICIPLFFSRAVGRTYIGLILTGVMAVVSIAASLILVEFMGIEAIALGQAIGAFIGFLVSMLMLSKHLTFVLPKKLFIKPIFASGSPLGLTRLYNLLAALTLNTLFLRIGGSEALAVFSVIFSIHRFNTAGIDGISSTVVPIVGVFHQEQDVTSIRQTMRLAFGYGNSLMLLVSILLIFFGAQIAAIFGLSDFEAFTAVLPFYFVYIMLLTNTTIFTSYYNASNRLKLANVIPLLQEFVFLCLGAYIFSVLFGINGLWAALPISGAATFAVLLAILIFIKVRDRDLSLPLLQKLKSQSEGRYVSFSVESIPQKAAEAAERIAEFCEENDLPPKKAMLLSVSIEEIILLIINNSKNKNFSVSVRLLLLDDGVIMRIRNAGEKFDVMEYYKSHIADDIEKSIDVIGMKYIVQAASGIYYRQTFGVNSLVVSI